MVSNMANVNPPNQSLQPASFSYEKWRQRFLQIVLWGAAIAGLAAVLSTLGETNLGVKIAYFVAYGILLLVTFTRLPYWLKASVFLFLIYAVGAIGLVETGIWADSRVFFLAFITMSGLLFSPRATLISGIICLVSIGITGWLVLTGQFTPTLSEVPPGNLSVWISGTVSMILLPVVIGSALASFQAEFTNTKKSTREYLTELIDQRSSLEKRVEERTADLEMANEKNLERANQLRTIAEISRSFTVVKNLDDLLPEIARKINEAFGFYHVGIFLDDEKDEYAVLRASNSAGGKKMLERGHRLRIGQIGIVGFVTGTGQARIALDVGDDVTYFDNPDLPNTRSEMALPLQSGGKIIGALDVQSVARAAFTQEDISILGLLADQISIAIQNARLFEETNAALADVREVYQRSVQTSWQEIARRGALGFRYANGHVETFAPEASSPQMTGRDSGILSIPINIRGETLGMLNIRQPGRQQAWNETESRLYQSIVERMSFALENARLLEDTLNRVAREQKIVEISTKIGSSVRIEQILQTAAEEISRTFEGADVLLQLQPGTSKDSTQ
ncbi:MAG: GAF domain-containing protein [Chloroflexi bacterium]|nr:MAG: GAF domain-containing protein [Chloroflexota bacterium]